MIHVLIDLCHVVFCVFTDSSSNLVCVARRLPIAEKARTMLGVVEQFTTKQDLNGKIIGCDIR